MATIEEADNTFEYNFFFLAKAAKKKEEKARNRCLTALAVGKRIAKYACDQCGDN